jgi:hypothetical protein
MFGLSTLFYIMEGYGATPDCQKLHGQLLNRQLRQFLFSTLGGAALYLTKRANYRYSQS